MKRALLLLGVLAIPGNVLAWGTSTSPPVITADERSQLGWVEDLALLGPTAFNQRFNEHTLAIPMHQYIAWSAVELLKLDPAYTDSGFPELDEINKWDGVEPSSSGVVEDTSPTLPNMAVLGPRANSAQPSPDAAYNRAHALNADYNTAAHEWNPWLQSGLGPTFSGVYYSALLVQILDDADAVEKGKSAQYMGHYVADPTSAKHADGVFLTPTQVRRMQALGRSLHGRVTEPIPAWLNCAAMLSPQDETTDDEIEEAYKILLQNSLANVGRAQALQYWNRVLLHIETHATFRRGSTTFVEVEQQKVCHAVGAYLLASAGTINLPRYWNYFDPFFFNGPPINAATRDPDFVLATPFSEHMFWETNPDQRAFIVAGLAGGVGHLSRLGLATTPATVHTNYQTFTPGSDFWSFDQQKRQKAAREAMEALVKAGSSAAHGQVGSAADFQTDFNAHLAEAIKHTLTAYRASITGIRIEEAHWTTTDLTNTVKLRLKIKNVGREPLRLRGVKVWADDGTQRRTLLTETVTGNIAAGATKEETFTFHTARNMLPNMFVDVLGSYATTPDAGLAREKVSALGVSSGVGALGTIQSGPVDLVVVFDTTGSMQPSIDNVRDNAIQTIRDLQQRTNDVRLGLVAYRDIAVDGLGEFRSFPFTDQLDQQFAVMRSWTADGGGDTPEDLLYGLELALNLWVNDPNPRPATDDPIKIVVYITDAPAHVPDVDNRTYDSMADFAARIDPAHYYPVLLGNDTGMQNDANELATRTQGIVLNANDPSQVSTALIDAVDAALAAHASAQPWGMSRGKAWFVVILAAVGLLALLAGLALVAFARGTP